jgi:hypothetical protein
MSALAIAHEASRLSWWISSGRPDRSLSDGCGRKPGIRTSGCQGRKSRARFSPTWSSLRTSDRTVAKYGTWCFALDQAGALQNSQPPRCRTGSRWWEPASSFKSGKADQCSSPLEIVNEPPGAVGSTRPPGFEAFPARPRLAVSCELRSGRCS